MGRNLKPMELPDVKPCRFTVLSTFTCSSNCPFLSEKVECLITEITNPDFCIPAYEKQLETITQENEIITQENELLRIVLDKYRQKYGE